MNSKTSRNLWSKDETDILIKFGEKLSLTKLLEKLPNRTKSSISRKRQVLFKKTMKKRVNPWTLKEEELLKKIAPDLTLGELSK